MSRIKWGLLKAKSSGTIENKSTLSSKYQVRKGLSNDLNPKSRHDPAIRFVSSYYYSQESTIIV